MKMEKDTNRIVLEKLYNARDLGGFLTKDGSRTIFGRFLRTDAPVDLSRNDLAILLSYPVRTVIDLRSSDETAKGPNSFFNVDSISYIPASIIDFSTDNLGTSDFEVALSQSMGAFYISMLEQKKEALRYVFSTMAYAPPGGILFHCTHGKDRTGVVSALLLLLAGVGREDILTSYEISYSLLRPLVDPLMKVVPPGKEYLLRSDRENMVAVLDFFDVNYSGDAEIYLKEIGLSRPEIQSIRDRLLRL